MTSLSSIRHHRLAWTPDHLELGDDRLRVGPSTCVWWRRPGFVPVEDLDADEGRLVAEELIDTLAGAITSCGARVVDAPAAIRSAELKLVQLSVASQIGATVPATLVTNDPDEALRFASDRSVVAKAISSGFGIAPFVDVVDTDELAYVATAPTMLQHVVEREADLRVVTVGDTVLTWRRPHAAEDPPDWRRVDPAGEGFKVDSTVVTHAVSIAEALGLTFSVQDWLVTPDGLVFLEVNPQGQWLFLEDADRATRLLVDHLLGETS